MGSLVTLMTVIVRVVATLIIESAMAVVVTVRDVLIIRIARTVFVRVYVEGAQMTPEYFVHRMKHVALIIVKTETASSLVRRELVMVVIVMV